MAVVPFNPQNGIVQNTPTAIRRLPGDLRVWVFDTDGNYRPYANKQEVIDAFPNVADRTSAFYVQILIDGVPVNHRFIGGTTIDDLVPDDGAAASALATDALATAQVAQEDINTIETVSLPAKQSISEKNQPNGYPSIDNVPIRMLVSDISSLSGTLKSNTIITTDISGTWNLDLSDTTTVANGGTLIRDANNRLWRREMFGIPFDIRLFGGVAGFNNTSAWTGFNNDIAIQKAIDAASKVYGGYVYIPNGIWGFSHIVIKNGVSVYCEPLTKFCVIPSVNSYFIEIDQGFIANVTWENIIIDGGYGFASGYNPDQTCFGIVAKYKVSDNTGGLWYSTFKNIEIRRFGKHCFYFEALDPDGTKDIANQFLSFENVKAYRTTSTTVTEANCLYSKGQFGQVQFDASCQFDGDNVPIEGDINIYLESSTTTGASDEVYSVYFNGTTFQDTDIAIKTYYAKSVFVAGHFERCARPVYAETGSHVIVDKSDFRDCGKKTIVNSTTIDGSLIYVGSTSAVSLDNSELVGSCDYICKAGSGYDGFYFGTGNKILGSYTGLNLTTAVQSNGILDVGNKNSRIVVGSSANVLINITSQKGVGQEIVVELQGNTTVSNTGNILMLNSATKLFFKAGQILRFRNLGNGFFILLNQKDAYISHGTTSPEGTIPANKGALYLQTTGSNLLWQKTTEDTGANNTGWLYYNTSKDVKLTKTATYVISINDFSTASNLVVYADATSGNMIISLPAASLMDGYNVVVIKTDSTSNTVTVKGNSTELINNNNLYVLYTQYSYKTFKSNGTQIYVSDTYTKSESESHYRATVNTSTAASVSKSDLNTAYPANTTTGVGTRGFTVAYPNLTGGAITAIKLDDSTTGDWQIITSGKNDTGSYNKTESDARYSVVIKDNTLTTEQTTATLNAKYPTTPDKTCVVAKNVGTGMMYFKIDNAWYAQTFSAV